MVIDATDETIWVEGGARSHAKPSHPRFGAPILLAPGLEVSAIAIDHGVLYAYDLASDSVYRVPTNGEKPSVIGTVHCGEPEVFSKSAIMFDEAHVYLACDTFDDLDHMFGVRFWGFVRGRGAPADDLGFWLPDGSRPTAVPITLIRRAVAGFRSSEIQDGDAIFTYAYEACDPSGGLCPTIQDIVRLDREGRSVVLAEKAYPCAMALDETYLYWEECFDNGIRRVPRNGGAVETVLPGNADNGTMSHLGLTVDDHAVYATDAAHHLVMIPLE